MVTRRQSKKDPEKDHEEHAEELPILPMPPLLTSESKKEFLKLATQLLDELSPTGAIEWILLQDLIYLTWDMLRFRRIKVYLLQNGIDREIKSRESIAELMEEAGETSEVDYNVASIQVDAIKVCLGDLESIERLLSLLDIQRDKALRQLRSYRAEFAALGQKKNNEVIEPKFNLVSKKNAA